MPQPRPTLYDTTTLRNFGAIDRLDLCEMFHEQRPEPRWSEAVKEELLRASARLELDADRVLREGWLGDPIAPAEDDLLPIVKLQVAIGNDARRNAGEAETIYFAEKLGGSVVTDDGPAYQFAAARLGIGNALDTVRILTDLVTVAAIRAKDAVALCGAMQSAGRRIRPGHPGRLPPEYFMVE